MLYYYGIHRSKGKRKVSSEDLWCNEVIDLSSPIHADKSHETPTSAVKILKKCCTIVHYSLTSMKYLLCYCYLCRLLC